MPTLDELAKQSLAAVGGGSISEMAEQSLEGLRIREHYPAAIRAVQGDFDWSVYRATRTLELASVPAHALWTRAFLLPTDMLVPRRVQAPGHQTVPYEFSVHPTAATRILYTNAESVALVYTSSRLGLESTPPYLFDLIVVNLAARLAMPLKHDLSLRTRLLRDYREALEPAKAIDANSEPELIDIDFIPESIRARFV